MHNGASPQPDEACACGRGVCAGGQRLRISCHTRPKLTRSSTSLRGNIAYLKYCPAFPGSFATLDEARAFCDVFFTYYNDDHRHSGIGLHTPASVHDGSAWAIQARRQQVLDDACAAHPERFPRGRPLAPALPHKVWINQPRPTIQTQEMTQIIQVA